MFQLVETPDLAAPVLIVAFDGWVSAGSVGTASADHIAGDEAAVIVEFDAESLFDFRVCRPTATFRDGSLERVEWPAVTIRHRRIEDHDVLVLSGPEPNWNWRRFAAAVADLAVRLEVTEQISLGGVPWAAPHTRPTEVITTASNPGLIGPDHSPPEGVLEVPAAIALTIEEAVSARGVPAVGFWARVPHYIGAVYYPGVVALVERVARRTGVTIPLGSLVDDAASQRRQLETLLEARPDVRSMIERYEQLSADQARAASGDEIATEIERFLREEAEGPDEFGG